MGACLAVGTRHGVVASLGSTDKDDCNRGGHDIDNDDDIADGKSAARTTTTAAAAVATVARAATSAAPPLVEPGAPEPPLPTMRGPWRVMSLGVFEAFVRAEAKLACEDLERALELEPANAEVLASVCAAAVVFPQLSGRSVLASSYEFPNWWISSARSNLIVVVFAVLLCAFDAVERPMRVCKVAVRLAIVVVVVEAVIA